jgi:hypothetical protein
LLQITAARMSSSSVLWATLLMKSVTLTLTFQSPKVSQYRFNK